MVKPLAALAGLVCGGSASAAHAACSLALVLALDVSASVDAQEYRQQLHGLAGALRAPKVQRQILDSAQAPIWLAAFEWSSTQYQRELLDWRPLSSRADIEAAADTLIRQSRQSSPPPTAIGAAMRYASSIFAGGPDCWRQTLDISGDGTNNDGPLPTHVHGDAAYQSVTVNGLVIGSDTATTGRDERQMELMELSAYFRRRVIHGPGAFIEIAHGFDDYERAMTRKLLRETKALRMGDAILAQ